MLRTVIAVNHNDYAPKAFSIVCEIPNRLDFDLEAAVRAAVADYCKTDEGQQLFGYNDGFFDWTDFNNVPNEFCEKHGFRKVKTDVVDLVVDWHEQLVDEDAICGN